MSDDERALLRTIAESPESDAPRLVYADWLEERGFVIRAEFIRLQIEIATLEHEPQPVRNGYVHLWKRQQELFDHHAFELNGPLASLAAGERVIHHRGFVSEIELTVDTFLDHAAEIAGLMPLPDVRVSHALMRLSELIVNPAFAVVTHMIGLDYGSEIPEFDPADYHGTLGDFVDALIVPKRLRTLDLEGCSISDAILWDLPTCYPSPPPLIDLDLSNNRITDEGVVTLLDTPLPRTLERVVLGGNPIGNQGAIELADRWPRNSPLKQLNLRFTNITREGHAALTARFGGIVDLF